MCENLRRMIRFVRPEQTAKQEAPGPRHALHEAILAVSRVQYLTAMGRMKRSYLLIEE